jgi:flagellar basal-body rod protein FlgF
VNKGIYCAASAMLVQESMHDVVANNLANVSTAGFRGRIPVNKTFPDLLTDRIENIPVTPGATTGPNQIRFRGKIPIGNLALANVLSETTMTMKRGAMNVTNAPLDVAIDGVGFFVVRDGAGNTFYTRSGQFQVNQEGQLLTHDGFFVQGDGGPIEIGEAENVRINSEGQVVADGEVVDTLQVVAFEEPTYLKHIGGSLHAANEQTGVPTPVDTPSLVSGTLEQSNVDVVSEMSRMIEAHRAYEAASKALMTHDDETGRLISSFTKT